MTYDMVVALLAVVMMLAEEVVFQKVLLVTMLKYGGMRNMVAAVVCETMLLVLIERCR